MINKSHVKTLFRLFPKELNKIFKNHLIFGFLCGSIVTNNIHKNSDIDIFVCVSKINRQEITKFHKWYFALHDHYKLQGDKEYPGEIMTLKQLEKALNKMAKTTPNYIVTNKILYDGIVWAGMLSGKYKGFTGLKNIFMKYRKMGTKIDSKWAKYLLKKLSGQPSNKILKRLVV